MDKNMIEEIKHTGFTPPHLFLLKHYFAVLYKHGFALQLDKKHNLLPRTENWKLP